MPQFVDGPLRELDSFVAFLRSFLEGVDLYDALDPRIKMTMSFGEFCHLKEKHRGGVG